MNLREHGLRFHDAGLTFRIPRRLPADGLPAAVRDAGHWFLDLLLRHHVRWQFDELGFVPLKAAYLRRVIQWRAWPTICELLQSLGIVRRDGRYIPGSKCFGYRLNPGWIPSRPVRCTDAKVASKIHAIREEARNRLLPVHKWLEPWLYRLDFDDRQALRIIRTLTPDADCPLTAAEYRTLIREQCARLADREWYLTVDPYGRVHTPVTSLPKAVRCCLSLDGQAFVEMDLANSQPLFAGLVARVAGLVARAYFQSSERNRRRLRSKRFSKNAKMHYDVQRMQTGDGDEREGRATAPCITMHKTAVGSTKQVVSERARSSAFRHLPVDLLDYLALCESGRLYESLMQPGDSRDEIKRRLFVVLYGRPQWRSDVGERFRKRFPTVWGMLADLKRREYQRAAWTMQHAESSLFIGAVCGRIMRERPAVPVLTIHDSLLTTPEHLGYVESVLLLEFARLGIRPALKGV